MLEAGVPLLRSLNTVGTGSPPRLQKSFAKLADGASQGIPLAETMARIPGAFDPVDAMLIDAAETSGSLPESLSLLSKWHEFADRMKKRLLAGFLLPFIIIHAAAFLVPFPSFALGGWHVGPYLRSVLTIFAVVYIPIALIWVVLKMTPRRGLPRRILHGVALRVPLGLGRAVRKMAIGRYAWVFHMLMKAGVPATDCAEKAADATSNVVIGNLFRPGAASARAGQPVWEGFSRRVPLDFLNIWQVGEESGTLVEATKRLADRNGEEAEFWFNMFATWFPRCVYFALMGWLAYSVISFYATAYMSMLSF